LISSLDQDLKEQIPVEYHDFLKVFSEKSTPINALIDLDAMDNLIHNNIVNQHNLPTSTLLVSINARNTDGSLNQGGPIVKSVTGILNKVFIWASGPSGTLY